MATLTVSASPQRTGINLTTAAVAADGGLSDKFLNDGATMFYVNNAGGSSVTLTLVYGPSAAVDGTSPANKTYTVAAGEVFVLGFFPTIYNDSLGYVNVQYSAVTSVKVLPFKCST